MYIEAYVTQCDITDVMYDKPVKGAYALARGATGRWCPVLAFGPEATEQHAIDLYEVETARELIEARGDWLDY